MKKRIWIPLLILILVFILWILLPVIIKNYVNDVLDDIDGYTGSVSNVDLNLFRGAYALDNLVLDKLDGEDRYPFIAIDQINISLEWGAIIKGKIVGEIELVSPDIYFVAETEHAEAQFGDDVDWVDTIQELMVFRINKFSVRDGSMHYMDLGSDPVVDLPMYNMELEILNISNVEGRDEKLPSSIQMTAVSVGGGQLNLTADANLLKQIPDIDLKLEFEGVNMPDLNDLLEAYAKVDAEQGEFSLYSQIVISDGNIEGYVQPVILNLSVLDLQDEDHDFFSAAWEIIVEGVTQIFRQQPRDQLATRVPLSGEIGDPEAGIFMTIWNVFRNAFIEAFEQAVEDIIDFEDAEDDNDG